MEASRRQFIQGGVSAIIGLTALKTDLIFGDAEAGQELRFSKADLERLQGRLRDLMATFDTAPYMTGQYAEIFKKHPSAMRFLDLEDLQRKSISFRDVAEEKNADLRYIYSFVHKEAGLGFAATPDATDEQLVETIRAMCKTMQHARDIKAASVLDGGLTYDMEVGGDGVPLLSTRHPTEDAMWSNTFPEYRPLTVENLREACVAIANGFVDDRNIKITARARKLVVPIGQVGIVSRMAADGTFPHDLFPEGWVRNDYLHDHDSWYILTNIDGMRHFERVGFEMDAWMPQWEWDPVEDKPVENKPQHVLGKSYERYSFGCSDPRAIFGVMKQAISVPKFESTYGQA